MMRHLSYRQVSFFELMIHEARSMDSRCPSFV